MAGGNIVLEGDFLGPDDPGSMAYKLAQIEAGEPSADKPEEEAAQTEADRQAAEATEAERVVAEEAAAAQAGADEETSEEKEAREKAEAEAAKAAAPPEPLEPPKFEPKHKTWEETEKSRLEAEARMTKATQETAEERKAREAAEAELETLRQKLAEKEKPPEKSAEELEAEQENRIAAALDEIDQLDDSDPNYRKLVARAWRKAGVGGAGQPAMPNQQALNEMVDRRVEERLQSREQTRTAETKVEAETRIIKEAEGLAGKAGLDMATPDSADFILFDHLRRKLPEEYDDKPLQEQVDWVVAEVRKKTGQVVQMTEAEREKVRKAQENNTVLGRGGIRPAAKPEAPKLRSMDEILSSLG